MSFSKLTFVVFMMLSVQVMVHGDNTWDCPQEGINTRNRVQIGRATKVNSWEECSALCAAKYECSLWSWVKPSGGLYARNCAIMSGTESTVYDGNVISGVKTCQGAGAMDDYVETEYGGGDCHSFDCFAK